MKKTYIQPATDLLASEPIMSSVVSWGVIGNGPIQNVSNQNNTDDDDEEEEVDFAKGYTFNWDED